MDGIPGIDLIDTRRSTRAPMPRLRPRGVPPSLEGHELFRSRRPHDLSAFLGGFLGRTAVFLDGRDGEFEAAVNVVELPALALAHIELATPTTFEIPETDDSFTVIVHTYGESVGMLGSRPISANPTRAIVTSPGCHLRVSFDEPGSQLILRMARDHLEATLSRMIGRRIMRPVVFEPELDLTSGGAVRWNIAMQLLGAEVMTPDSLLHRQLGQPQLEDLLASSLLLIQPSSYSSELVPRSGRKGVVRMATDFIERHLGESLSTARVADALHVGPRSLQQAFRDTLGATPTEYIRQRRLDRVHADLKGASVGDGMSVSQVARRWGFTHLGDFASTYRARFGESPSATLRGES